MTSFALIGAAVIWDSLRVGMQWGSDGPEPGYFPFYIGVLLLLGAAKVLTDVVRQWNKDDMTDSFATHEEIGMGRSCVGGMRAGHSAAQLACRATGERAV